MKKLSLFLFVVVMSCSQTSRERYTPEGEATESKKRKQIALNLEPTIEEETEEEPLMIIQDENQDEKDIQTEEYEKINENPFWNPMKKPLSTFSIDVDVASYANVRRFLENGQLPPTDAVRIEEMINYFDYQYPQPTDEHPFKIITEVGSCPWSEENKLLHIGIQGKDIPTEKLPPSNLIFLLDVSGSMSNLNKLPLLKSSLKMLVNKKLRPQDKVGIVVYAGAAGVVLKPTHNKEKIIDALNRLEAGGSTAGGEGIQVAYQLAEKYKTSDSNNRIILATDGDFNVGVSSNSGLEKLIEEKRKSGIFLTVLGLGMGNYKDSKMEILADKGNGNYAYIDKLSEAQKVLLQEFGGTLFTIAKDVKIQVEFNPVYVQAYRLIGYENRALADEDFNDDRKDAGDLGAGHTVTALYEIIPTGTKNAKDFRDKVDKLKYQGNTMTTKAQTTDEMLTLKLRYKQPDGTKSQLLTTTVNQQATVFPETSESFRFSAVVAQFGMLLRNSEFKGSTSTAQIIEIAQKAKGKDTEGYRHEFIRLVKNFEGLE